MPRPCSFMHLDFEPSVLEITPIWYFTVFRGVDLRRIIFENTMWQTSKSSVYEMHAGCVLEMSLFKVRFACDILKLSSMWKISIQTWFY